MITLNRDYVGRINEMRLCYGEDWWAERMEQDILSYTSLMERIPLEAQGQSSLELGAGEGTSLLSWRSWAMPFLEEIGFSSITELELLPEEVICGDMENIPFPSENFDTVISRHVLEHTINPTTVLQEICRVTKRGGYSAHIVPAFAGSEEEPAHLTNWDWEQWEQAWIATGFEVIEGEYLTFHDRELHMLLRRPE